jgi:heme-degrading monooxygenase HmoA
MSVVDARASTSAIAVLALTAGRPAGNVASTAPARRYQMIVMFSARRLKPGAWEQFRRAWDPGDAKPPGFQRAYHARNIRDEDEVISFGLFDMSKDDYHRWRGEADAQENQRVDRLSAFVENEHVAGVYEVIDEVTE